ncbi:MAG: right-handed parallel beta-helix repeat-containing protein [Okeania sp. SIO2B9]|nr:right-handed parallel beta-helix repeat-containing protein [Okeania sp. SIO2B9]NET76961.1 right-handed parallel beta-helix repeat-containing protein [Okeania sp. SIO1F9]
MTGNVNRGGNWNLELIFGQLKSALAFTPEVRASYAGVLANIVVDTTDDVVDDSDGVTSLREAIIEANSTPEDDTIQLTAGERYNLTISGSDEDAAATGDLDIVAGGGEITVISQGDEKAVIDAGGIEGLGDRVFHVLSDAALQLENVEITGGFANDSPGGGALNNYSGTVNISNSTISGNSADILGGGINNFFGTLNISNSTITGNSVDGNGGGIDNSFATLNISNSTITGNSGTNGGGIFNLASTVTITNSTISDNSVDGNGGGIDNLGTANITNSTISGNSANSGGGFRNSGTANISNSNISGNSAYLNDGGGIDNLGTASLTNSNISENSAYNGGGINNLGTATINNSTLSGNVTFLAGGGIRNSGTTNVSNSTFSTNSANSGGGIYNTGTTNVINSTFTEGISNYGGGIYNAGTTSISNSTITANGGQQNQGSGILTKALDELGFNPTTIVTSTIVSGNFSTDFDSIGTNNTIISGGNNLIGIGNAINIFNGDNDQTGVTDPLLGNLVDNGGQTLTLPLPNSPAIDAGSNPNSLTTDQRGEPRFVGEGVDIGAVELQNSPQITGTPKSDILNGTNENDTITGLAGNDTINGRGGDDQIIGSRGNDFLYGKEGNDTLQGRLGSDHLFGGNGDDSLVGGQGRDRFNGGAGNDTLIGGASIDHFIFNTNDEFDSDDIGIDDITDFVPGQDIILLDKSTFTAITSDSGTGFSVNAEFDIVTSDADAEISEAFIVYNSNNGKLFYNANGTEAEFGSGGEFANLTNIASISKDDFLLRG